MRKDRIEKLTKAMDILKDIPGTRGDVSVHIRDQHIDWSRVDVDEISTEHLRSAFEDLAAIAFPLATAWKAGKEAA